MKRNYLISIVVTGLIVLSLYSTYAMFTETIETDEIINMNASVLPLESKIVEYEQIIINGNEAKSIMVNISNSTESDLYYGVWYEMVNPTSINDNIEITKLTSSTDSTQGQINAGVEKNVKIVIKNTGSSSITVNIGVCYSETSSLELPTNRYIITNEIQGKYVINTSVTNGSTVETIKIVNIENTTSINVTPNIGYKYKSASCTNATASYNTETNTLTLTNITDDVSCTVIFEMSVINAVKYINNLYNTSSKSTFVNNSITYTRATSVNLMTDIGGNIRYYGANPNNYVKFNNELWRIIGVFKNIDNGTGKKATRVKIIRNESIGKYSWDSSNSYTNSGWGVNEWNQADLMTLLNNGPYYNRNSGVCYVSYNNVSESCNFNNIGLLNDSKQLIQNAIWYLGGFTGYGYYADDFYAFERGNSVYSGRSLTWTGKVALMYPSDYMYAGDLSICTTDGWNWNETCRDTSWLGDASSNQWTLTHDNGYSYATSAISSSGVVVGYFMDYLQSSIKPAVFLKSTVKITGGTGTSTDPYTLSL